MSSGFNPASKAGTGGSAIRSRMPRGRWGVLAIASSAAMAAGVAFVVNMLMSLQLEPGDRGRVALVLQAAYFLAPVILLGRERALLRKDSNPDAWIPVLPLLLPLSLAVAVAREWAALVLITALVVASLNVERNRAVRRGSARAYLVQAGAYQCSILVGAVALAVLSVRDPVLWSIPYSAIALWYGVREISGWWQSKQLVVRGLFNHVYLLPSTLANIVTMRADRLLLPLQATISDLGIYVAVATATEPVIWLAQSLADQRSGSTSDVMPTLGGFLLQCVRDLRFLIPIACIGAAVIAFGIVPILGSAYSSGLGLVLPLSVASVMLALYRQGVAVLLGGTRPGLSSVCEGVVALVAIPLYALFIHAWGLQGAAWGSLMVYTSGLAVSLFFLYRSRRGA